MKSIETFMTTQTRFTETSANERSFGNGLLVFLVVMLTGFVIWSGLLLFSIPGALDAVALALASGW